MRVVRDLADLPAAVAAARGRGGVRVRRRRRCSSSRTSSAAATSRCRCLADRHGTVLVLGERDCSLQRRHQKVVEEAPAPAPAGADPARRCTTRRARPPRRSATRRRARSSSCRRGARPVLLPGDEHPAPGRAPGHRVRYGVDLVALQLGSPRAALRSERTARPYGHAIEVRLYAEDPAADWQPQSGTLTAFDVPGVNARVRPAHRPGVRARLGLRAPATRSAIHYDAMLAKVIAWAPDPGGGRARLAARSAARIHGVTTNRDLLVATLRHPAFLAGELTPPSSSDATVAALPRTPRRRCRQRPRSPLPSRRRRDRTVQRGIPVGVAQRASRSRSVTDVRGDQRVEWYRAAATATSSTGTTWCRRAPTGSRSPTAGVATTYDVGGARRPGRGGRRHGSHVRLRRGAPVRRPGRRRRRPARCSRRCPAPWSSVLVAERRPGRGGQPPARARGDEDAAHRERAGVRHGHRARREGRQQVAAGAVLAVVSTGATTENGEES